MDRLKEEQVECVKRQDYIAAEQLKNDIEEASKELNDIKNQPVITERQEKRTDMVTILKCLDIAAAILVSPQVTFLTDSLKSLKESFIQELLIVENDNIRVKALRCYVLYGIIDKEIALTGIHIFSTPVSTIRFKCFKLLRLKLNNKNLFDKNVIQSSTNSFFI